MPSYEYRCEKCGKKFELVQHVTEHEKKKPHCPKCNSQKVERVFSTFFAKTSKKS